MCGILFSYSVHQALNQYTFKTALSTLDHRGPDGSDIWINENNNMAIGHTRLAINGGSEATQPLFSPDAQLILAVNGEIYNKPDTLNKSNYSFQTTSDSEIILKLYNDYSHSAFDMLDGEFAFVLWDEAQQQAILCRDRHGIKPLYYAEYDGVIHAASEIKALLALGIPARWNRRFLEQSKYFICNAQETFIEGIYAVPPGHYIKISQGEMSTHSYTQRSPLLPSTYEKQDLSYFEACQALEKLLLCAVEKRISRSTNNASYLSGGIDSTLITAIAAEREKHLNSFTISFPGSKLDEAEQARSLCKSLGIEHHTIAVDNTVMTQHFEDCLRHCEMPVPNLNVVAKYCLSKAVREKGFKVALTGEGADEALIGYNFFDQDINNSTAPHDITHPLSQTYIRHCKHLPAQLNNALFTGNLLDSLSEPSVELIKFHRDLIKSISATDKIQCSQALHYQTVFQNYNLGALGDRTEMAHSVEGRPPFLDRQLVEFIHGLPTEYKHDGQTNKKILREIAKKYLPPAFCNAPKLAFTSPQTTLEKGTAFYGMLRDQLTNPNFLPAPYKANKVAKLLAKIEKQPEYAAALEPTFLHLVSISLLQKQFSLSI